MLCVENENFNEIMGCKITQSVTNWTKHDGWGGKIQFSKLSKYYYNVKTDSIKVKYIIFEPEFCSNVI